MDLDQRAKRASIIENTTVKKNTDWLQYEWTLREKMGEKNVPSVNPLPWIWINVLNEQASFIHLTSCIFSGAFI